MQIVEGKQPQSEDFPGPEQVAEVGAREPGDVRMRRLAKRPRVLGMDEVLDVQRAVEREGHAVAGHAGGHHAVEHVHAAADHFQNLRRRAEAHGVARLVLREKRHRVFDGAEHLVLGLAHRDAADRVAVEIQFHQLAGRLLAQIRRRPSPGRCRNEAAAPHPSAGSFAVTQSLQRRAQRVVSARDLAAYASSQG